MLVALISPEPRISMKITHAEKLSAELKLVKWHLYSGFRCAQTYQDSGCFTYITHLV